MSLCQHTYEEVTTHLFTMIARGNVFVQQFFNDMFEMLVWVPLQCATDITRTHIHTHTHTHTHTHAHTYTGTHTHTHKHTRTLFSMAFSRCTTWVPLHCAPGITHTGIQHTRTRTHAHTRTHTHTHTHTHVVFQ